MAGRATRTPTRAEPKIGRPGGMPTISTVAQGGAQRSEQYLEARTGEGARAAARQPAQVLQSGSPQMTWGGQPGASRLACPPHVIFSRQRIPVSGRSCGRVDL